jgi:hypothetical protein
MKTHIAGPVEQLFYKISNAQTARELNALRALIDAATTDEEQKGELERLVDARFGQWNLQATTANRVRWN